ncbi:hypothetical protein GPECTOR_43g864 [Gonium pectorale]|uniref:Uncharacterized protein n=1 Tax=Gonium pectorale TaxID=33097 RepID=A0A150G9C0_GONPE|nr:hypothetical protein GPECTOR_43g864 [Gonium pectorale]|eukprot:KXZ46428.1 hypothetical protein GPECTOR_43g864 [Gonium pectorale]
MRDYPAVGGLEDAASDKCGVEINQITSFVTRTFTDIEPKRWIGPCTLLQWVWSEVHYDSL